MVVGRTRRGARDSIIAIKLGFAHEPPRPLRHGHPQQEQFWSAQSRPSLFISLIYLLYVAVKRIMQEARELANDPSTDYAAGPLEVCVPLLLPYR